MANCHGSVVDMGFLNFLFSLKAQILSLARNTDCLANAPNLKSVSYLSVSSKNDLQGLAVVQEGTTNSITHTTTTTDIFLRTTMVLAEHMNMICGWIGVLRLLT